MSKTNFSHHLSRQGAVGTLYLKNFKAFGPVGQTMPLSRINLLFGPNSCGKSTVFQAIHLIMDSLSNGGVAKGNFSSIVHKGRKDEPIVLGWVCKNPTEVRVCKRTDSPVPDYPPVFFTFRQIPEDRIGLERIEVYLYQENVISFSRRGENFEFDQFLTTPGDLEKYLRARVNFRTKVRDDDISTLQGWLRLQLLPFPMEYSYRFEDPVPPNPVLSAVGQALEIDLGQAANGRLHLTNNLIHLGPIRLIPDRDKLIEFSKMPQIDPLQDVETFVWQELMAQIRENSIRTVINDWLGPKGIDLGYEIGFKDVGESAKGDQSPGYLFLKDSDPFMKDLELDFKEVGVGVSQVIPVVGACYTHNDMWVLIEQPELHLHPKVECALADVFIGAYDDARVRGGPLTSFGNTFFLETHSEHLVLRMLRRIRETASGKQDQEHLRLTPEDISVFYLESTKEGVRAHFMETTRDGDFVRRWPEGFFPERAMELFE